MTLSISFDCTGNLRNIFILRFNLYQKWFTFMVLMDYGLFDEKLLLDNTYMKFTTLVVCMSNIYAAMPILTY